MVRVESKSTAVSSNDDSSPWSEGEVQDFCFEGVSSARRPAPKGQRFAWPAYSGPTSHVIHDPQDWQDAGLLVPHEAFRWYFGMIRKVVPNLETPHQCKIFFNFLEKYFFFNLHHHHNIEEDMYNPWIVSRGGVMEESVAKDHEEILSEVDGIMGMRQAVESGDVVALDMFKARLSALIEDIDEHMASEESSFPAQLRATDITEEENEEFTGKIIASLGLTASKRFLPVILYAMSSWKGEAAAKAMVGTLPLPIRLLAKYRWMKDFYVNQLVVLEKLADGSYSQNSKKNFRVGQIIPDVSMLNHLRHRS